MIQHNLAMNAVQSESVVGTVLVDLAVILSIAFVFVKLANRLRQPAVMGEIIAGIALGPSLLGLAPGHLTRMLFPPEVLPYLQVLAQLGIVLFMFGIGYRLNFSDMSGAGSRVTAVSLSCVALPFALGTGLSVLLYPWFNRSELSTRGMTGPALFLGAAMSITAFPVLARIITERGMQNGALGTMALASAAIQDFLAWCVLAVVVTMVTVSGPWSLARIAIGSLVFLLALRYLVRPALAWLLAPERRWAGNVVAVQAVLICGLLLTAWATNEIGLHVVFGAFLFGVTVPRTHVDVTAREIPERIEQMSTLLLPVFFTVTGLSVNLGGLGMRGLVMMLAVILVACAGKFVGAAGAARLTGMARRHSAALGVLLNARGLTELIILNVGLRLHALDTRLFTALVVMALVTTLMSGPLLSLLLGRADDETLPRTDFGPDLSTGELPADLEPAV